MLQRNNAEPVANYVYAEAGSPEQAGLGELVDFAFGFLRRQYVVISFFTLLAAAGGIAYLYVTPATYKASAKIIIGAQRAPFIQQQSMFADAPLDSAELESQLQILQSESIALAVIEKLRLLDDPEFAASGGRSILGSIRGVFEVLFKPSATKAAPDPKEAAVATFADRLKVNRVGISRVIEIDFSSRSPQRAAQIADAVAHAYIADQVEAKQNANRVASTWLQERLQQLGEQSTLADREVLAFKQQNNIVESGGRRLDEQSLADLNARLVAARTQTSDALARLNRIEVVIRTSDAALESSVSDVLTNPILTNLRQQYLDLARREAEYSARFGRDHLAVVNLRNRMRDLRKSTADELRRLSETFKSDYEVAKERQVEIEKQLDKVLSQSQTADKAHVVLRGLETNAKTYHDLHDGFLQRHMAGIQQESFPHTETRLISSASTPTSRKPKPLLVLALALLGGIGLGAGAGLLREVRDRVFRTGAQLQSLLQMPCLALVPLLNGTAPTQPRLQQPRSNPPRHGTILRDASVFWRICDSPLSRFAEAIRSIKLATNLQETDGSHKVIGLTSSLPNEGKSTIAGALAQLIAYTGGRVILVDCDLRNPSLSRCLAPKATAGIVDVVSGARSLGDTVWRDPTTNLAFLPATGETPVFYSSETLGSESTRRLFDKLRESFDFVIVDLPPLAPVVDTRVATQLVDCMILVIEWGRTKIDIVQQALNTAPNVHEAVIGAVLNKTDMRQIGRHDTHRKSFYNNKHYAKYGYS
jgi:succinoglycan biosynthesis transport protein ExoP